MASSINNDVNLGGAQTITGNKSFTGTITGTTQEGTDNSTKLATTATVRQQMAITGGLSTFNKGQSGYFRFVNGLRVQWGYSSSAGTDTTITFPVAFSSATSYAVIPTMLASTNYGYPSYVKSQTATNFVIRRNDSNKPATLWLAIGY